MGRLAEPLVRGLKKRAGLWVGQVRGPIKIVPVLTTGAHHVKEQHLSRGHRLDFVSRQAVGAGDEVASRGKVGRLRGRILRSRILGEPVRKFGRVAFHGKTAKLRPDAPQDTVPMLWGPLAVGAVYLRKHRLDKPKFEGLGPPQVDEWARWDRSLFRQRFRSFDGQRSE